MSLSYSQTWASDFVKVKDAFGNDLIVAKHAAETQRHKKSIVKILPRNIPAAALLQGTAPQDIQIDLDKGVDIDYCDRMFFRFQIANSGTGTTLVDAFSQIEYVEIVNVANGETLQKRFGAELREAALLSYSEETLRGILPDCGIDPATHASNLTIATNGTFQVCVPLDTCINQCPFPLWRPPVFRVNIRYYGNSQIVIAGSINGITTTQFELWMEGVKLDNAVRRLKDAQYVAEGPKTYRFYHCDRNTVTLGSVTNGIQTTANYNSSGKCGWALCQLLDMANSSGAAFYTSQPITNLDVLSNNNVINHNLGDNNLTTTFSNHQQGFLLFPNPGSIANSTYPQWYYFSLTEDPINDLHFGSVSGFYTFDGSSMSFRVTPGATIANASLRVYAYFSRQCTIDFNTGKISVSM
jgi:peptidoglycan hydrolase-like protein with peptidoglycan-binding domain